MRTGNAGTGMGKTSGRSDGAGGGRESPVLPTWKVFEFGIFAFSIGQLTMSSETHSVEDAGAVPLTLESVEAEANRQRMEAAGKKRVAEKSQAEEQGEKKEKVLMFVGLILGLCLSIAFCELQAETMRFAIKFEPSAVQFSWYELECQLREILGDARVQQGLEEGTFGVTCLRPDAAEIERVNTCTASTQNGTDIQKFYQKNLTCQVSAGSRLVL
ncbi:hypothetical protein PAPYR_11824 [Paratrimastix pyriformis]|uniref:Uncharacterized protein n=1 Tax=Paratrimastix pyriformis TaxID=342808 RepID=A0ABQ8U2Z4_9EUKA|nr:hypothetical protein PAPYR_11824 [Paratrimastix pyriformis]